MRGFFFSLLRILCFYSLSLYFLISACTVFINADSVGKNESAKSGAVGVIDARDERASERACVCVCVLSL